MSSANPKASELVEQGLTLYSEGRLDDALAKWDEALAVDPAVPRASEYSQYVRENRAALDASFRAASSSNYPAVSSSNDGDEAAAANRRSTPSSLRDVGDDFGGRGFAAPGAGAEAREPSASLELEVDVDLGQLGGDPAIRGGAAAGDGGAIRGGDLPPLKDPSLAEAYTDDDGTPRFNVISMAEAELDVTERVELDDYQASIDRSRDASPPIEARDRQPTPLTLLRGGGGPMPSGNDFEPAELTPVGITLPEPSHLVAESELSSAARTPASLRQMDDAATELPPLTADVDPGGGAGPAWGGDEAGFRGRSRTAEGAAQAAVVVEHSDQPEDDPSRIASMLAGAKQLHQQGTHEGALWLCQRILSIDAEHPEASQLLEQTQAALLGHYERQLGDLDTVPAVQVPPHEIIWHKLDHRAGFLLSRIDGVLSFNDILDISGMSRFEACRILSQLLEQGVIAPRGGG